MKLRRPRYKTRLQWEMLEWELQEAKLHNQKLVESNEVLMDDVRELQEKLAEANANIPFTGRMTDDGYFLGDPDRP